MINEQTVRAGVVTTALSLLGTPYRWDGKDVSRDGGLDCSGFAELCLRSVGIALPEYSSDTLWRSLPALNQSPAPGDLAFYGDGSRVHHVVLVLAPGGSAIIGASGGGPPKEGEGADEYGVRMAAAQAGVRIEDWRHGGARYREDFVGFRRLPWERCKTP